MKFKLIITKDIIDRSKICGTNEAGPNLNITKSCALGQAYNELVPAFIGNEYVVFSGSGFNTNMELTLKQKQFVRVFDNLKDRPEERYSFVGEEFDVEIPDSVIDQLYTSEVEVIQKLVNSKSLIPKTKNNETIQQKVMA